MLSDGSVIELSTRYTTIAKPLFFDFSALNAVETTRSSAILIQDAVFISSCEMYICKSMPKRRGRNERVPFWSVLEGLGCELERGDTGWRRKLIRAVDEKSMGADAKSRPKRKVDGEPAPSE